MPICILKSCEKIERQNDEDKDTKRLLIRIQKHIKGLLRLKCFVKKEMSQIPDQNQQKLISYSLEEAFISGI